MQEVKTFVLLNGFSLEKLKVSQFKSSVSSEGSTIWISCKGKPRF